MTKIEVYDEDVTELTRLANLLGTTTAEIVNVLLAIHGHVVMTLREKLEE
jgi:hypothetical protein